MSEQGLRARREPWWSQLPPPTQHWELDCGCSTPEPYHQPFFFLPFWEIGGHHVAEAGFELAISCLSPSCRDHRCALWGLFCFTGHVPTGLEVERVATSCIGTSSHFSFKNLVPLKHVLAGDTSCPITIYYHPPCPPWIVLESAATTIAVIGSGHQARSGILVFYLIAMTLTSLSP